MHTILATTYAVHPTKGSEDGMGWNYLLQIARFNNVIAVTRENNREAIEAYFDANSSAGERISFLYFDLPEWQRFWKKGSRGALLYFWMWQRAIPAFVNRQNLSFDIVHNLNFHNDWTPSYLWKLEKPFVWGPIGHHNKIPNQFLTNYTSKYKIKNALTWIVKKLSWNFSSSLQKTLNHADYIYAMNDSVTQQLSLKSKKYIVRPSVASQDFGWNKSIPTTQFNLISAGRFVPLKGFDLTINSFAQFLSGLVQEQQAVCHLTLVGSGPEEAVLRDLIKSQDLENHVTIIPWLERTDLLNKMKSSSAFLFPSHEGAGMVVAEALSFGLPIICLKNTGPAGYINPSCGFAVAPESYVKTVQNLSEAIGELFHQPTKHQNMRIAARNQFETMFKWDVRGEWLDAIYKTITS